MGSSSNPDGMKQAMAQSLAGMQQQQPQGGRAPQYGKAAIASRPGPPTQAQPQNGKGLAPSFNMQPMGGGQPQMSPQMTPQQRAQLGAQMAAQAQAQAQAQQQAIAAQRLPQSGKGNAMSANMRPMG